MCVHWIDQREKQIHIEKVRCHGVSSRRRLTNSSVTTPADWTGKTGKLCLALSLEWLARDGIDRNFAELLELARRSAARSMQRSC